MATELRPRRRPSIWTPLGLVAVDSVLYVLEGTTKSRDIQMGLQAIMLAVAIAVLYCIIDLISWVWFDRRRLMVDGNISQNLALSESETRRAEMLMQMTDAQIEAYGRQRVEIEVIASNVAPIYTLVLPFCRVPYDFLDLFFNSGTDTHLCPVRRFGEGTKHREYAQALTDYFVGEQYATLGDGNQPAAWRSPRARRAGLMSIDYGVAE
jgi:hypothetical protein